MLGIEKIELQLQGGLGVDGDEVIESGDALGGAGRGSIDGGLDGVALAAGEVAAGAGGGDDEPADLCCRRRLDDAGAVDGVDVGEGGDLDEEERVGGVSGLILDEDVDAEVGEGLIGEVVVDLEVGVEGLALQGGLLEDLELDFGAEGGELGPRGMGEEAQREGRAEESADASQGLIHHLTSRGYPFLSQPIMPPGISYTLYPASIKVWAAWRAREEVRS